MSAIHIDVWVGSAKEVWVGLAKNGMGWVISNPKCLGFYPKAVGPTSGIALHVPQGVKTV